MKRLVSLVEYLEPVIARCKDVSLFPSKQLEWVVSLPTVGDVNSEYLCDGKKYNYQIVQTVGSYTEIPHYTLGKPTDIMFYNSSYIEFEQILELIKDKAYKFPLIFVDANKVEWSMTGAIRECTLGRIIIATNCNPEWTTDIRDFQNFDTILRPLVNTFFDSLDRFGYTIYETKREWKEWKFFGKEGENGSTGNLFSDFVDAIEIKNLKLTLKNKC